MRIAIAILIFSLAGSAQAIKTNKLDLLTPGGADNVAQIVLSSTGSLTFNDAGAGTKTPSPIS